MKTKKHTEKIIVFVVLVIALVFTALLSSYAAGTVTVYTGSGTIDDDTSIAAVTGGGTGNQGDSFTITRTEVHGYQFDGWYVDDIKQQGETGLTFTFTPETDCYVKAVYIPLQMSKLSITGPKFRLNSGTNQQSYYLSSFETGTTLTIEYTDTAYNFLYWVNANDKILSKSKSFEITLTGDTTLRAVYGKKNVGTSAMVAYVSDSDQLLRSELCTANTNIYVPAGPSKLGYTFLNWSLSVDEIHAMVTQTNFVLVKPVYSCNGTETSVTIGCQSGGTAIAPDTELIAVKGETHIFTAPSVENHTFSYWKIGNDIVSYSDKYKLMISGTTALTAVYDETGFTAGPVIVITGAEIGEGNKLSFTATRSVPSGYTLVKQGFVYSLTSQNATLESNTKSYEFANKELCGSSVLNIKTNHTDRTFYVRGYMILRDTGGNLLPAYYSPAVSLSLNG